VADVHSATHNMVAQCGAGGKPKLVLLSTLTRLWCRYHLSQRCEPVDLPLLLSQTKCIWSLAPVEADVHSATHDMVAQCGAGDQPKLVLLSTLTKLWCRCHLSQRCEPVDLPLPLSQTKCIWSLAPVVADVHSATHDMVAQSDAGGQPKLILPSTLTRL
jgi:hypothetical protein